MGAGAFECDHDGSSERPDAFSAPAQSAAALIAAVAVASLAYRLIFASRLQQTAALFVGIPALLAIVVVLVVSPRSATGVACKAVTVGLLVSLLFLGEGMLCVLMSAPLFYAVAVAIGRAMDWARRRTEKRGDHVVFVPRAAGDRPDEPRRRDRLHHR